MKASVVLRPSMSKRLIAKGLKEYLNSLKVLDKGIVFISLGTTNSFIVEELTDLVIDKNRYMAGYIGNGKLTTLDKNLRIDPIILIDGKVSKENADDVVEKMGKGDVFIKGGNAIDYDGNVGVLVADRSGGTVGKYIGKVMARGVKWVSPISIGKLVPDVIEASYFAKIEEWNYSMGLNVALFPIVNAIPITEIEALNIIFDVDAVLIARGGLWEDEGSIVLGIEGKEENIKKTLEYINSIKGEEIPKLNL